MDGLTFKVNDGQADSEAAEVRLEVAQSVCSLYPITLEAARLADVLSSEEVVKYDTAAGSGNYSLLTWDGANE